MNMTVDPAVPYGKRKIKFRGKSEEGKWHYGDLRQFDDRDSLHNGQVGIYTDDRYDWRGCPIVDPDTVGQYSGFKDYNGNDIYEGDILYCSIADCRHAYREVVFHRGGFCLRDWFSTTPIANHNIKAWEIVGIIYDNPELVDIVNGRRR